MLFIVKTWTDDKLVWNPNDFDGIKELRLPHYSIWKPVSFFTLFNLRMKW